MKQRNLPDRGLRLILRFAWLILLVAAVSGAAPAPPSATRPALSVNPAIQRWIESMDVRELAGDDYFVKALQSVLRRPGAGEEDKADAFYLMLKKIRWSFSGAIQIPPGYDYPQTFRGHVVTFLSYQEKLHAVGYNAASLLQMAATECRTNVVRASHALLLSAIVDPASTRARLPFFIDPAVIEGAQVPDIMLHHVALAAALSHDEHLVENLGKLWDAAESGEAREDILCGLGLFSKLPQIKSLLAREKDPSHELTMETGVIILQRVSPAQAFATAFSEVMMAGPMWTHQLAELQQREFRARAIHKNAFWKTWGGMDIVTYDDGFLVTHGAGFRDFIAGGDRGAAWTGSPGATIPRGPGAE